MSIPVTVIGFGSSARTFHLPFLQSLPDEFHLHSIQQRPGSKSGPDAASAYPSTIIHPSIDSVFGLDAKVDQAALTPLPKGGLVVITIANKLHFSTAKLALQNGRHVLCEKPLALKHEEVLELEKLATENGLVCSAFQNRRFDSDFLTLRSLLPTAIGRPLYFESHFDRYRPLSKGGWREEVPPSEGGGILWDLGSHLVDQSVALFGAPDSLFAIVRNSRGQQQQGGGPGAEDSLDDSFTLHLFYKPSADPLPASSPAAGTHPAGLHATLSASVTAPHTDDAQLRFKVHGANGASFVKYGLDPQEGQLKKGWTPAKQGDAFGRYEEAEKEGKHVEAILTEMEAQSKARDWSKEKGDPTKPPKLVEKRIPVEQGRYIDLYKNLAEVIGEVNAAGIPSERSAIVQAGQKIPTSEVAIAIRILELARQSATEGRVVTFTM